MTHELAPVDLPEDTPEIVAMTVYNGQLVVATKTRIYIRQDDGKLHPLEFVRAGGNE